MTRQDLPRVVAESDKPDSDRHHDSSRPLKWELEKSLATVRDAVEQNASLLETLDELSENLQRERRRADALEDQLARFQRSSRDEDSALDRRIRILADQVEEITRPKTMQTADVQAATTTATMLNAVRKRETLLELAKWVAIVIVFVLTLLGVRLPGTKTDIEVPDTRPAPAGTGFAGRP